MKKILSIIVITSVAAFVMTACNTNPQSGIVGQQTVRYDDTVGFAKFQEWKQLNERTDPVTGYQAAISNQTAKAVAKPTTAKSTAMSSSSTNQAKVAKKKGWSKSAKYSVIGGVAGGTLGAVINKKDRVKGGIIGAVLGAGGGYVFGRSQDKKDGRIN